MKQQGGFTLIELITVIVILGILSAFALPRFAGLEAQAREAKMSGALAAVRSGAALAHAAWLAQSQPAAVTMEGQSIDIVNGYPDAETIHLAAGVANDADFDFTSTATTQQIEDEDIATCNFVYTEAAANAQPAITNNISTANCD